MLRTKCAGTSANIWLRFCDERQNTKSNIAGVTDKIGIGVSGTTWYTNIHLLSLWAFYHFLLSLLDIFVIGPSWASQHQYDNYRILDPQTHVAVSTRLAIDTLCKFYFDIIFFLYHDSECHILRWSNRLDFILNPKKYRSPMSLLSLIVCWRLVVIFSIGGHSSSSCKLCISGTDCILYLQGMHGCTHFNMELTHSWWVHFAFSQVGLVITLAFLLKATGSVITRSLKVLYLNSNQKHYFFDLLYSFIFLLSESRLGRWCGRHSSRENHL